jgi:hypothetical protein
VCNLLCGGELVCSGKFVDAGREDWFLVEVVDADVVSDWGDQAFLVNADGAVFCEGNAEDVGAEDWTFGIDCAHPDPVFKFLLELEGREVHLDFIVTLLAALALLEDFGFLALVGGQEVADVNDQGLVALHDFHFALQLQLDWFHFEAETWAPFESWRELLSEEDAYFEFWEVHDELVVVDLDDIEDTLQVELSFGVSHKAQVVILNDFSAVSFTILLFKFPAHLQVRRLGLETPLVVGLVLEDADFWALVCPDSRLAQLGPAVVHYATTTFDITR